MNDSRKCQHCKAKLPTGSRSDRKFCSDICRNAHNNERPKPPMMSLREHYAGLAMQGILAGADVNNRNSFYVNDGFIHTKSVAEVSVQCAEELIKRLEKHG